MMISRITEPPTIMATKPIFPNCFRVTLMSLRNDQNRIPIKDSIKRPAKIQWPGVISIKKGR